MVHQRLSQLFGLASLLLKIEILHLLNIPACKSMVMSSTHNLSGIKLHSVPLRRSDPKSPWCYAATVDPSTTATNLPRSNFLATQVWPSARVAASTIERCANSHLFQSDWTVCEWGCGPALPSLTLAKLGLVQTVIATDVDVFCLQMAKCAADAQDLKSDFRTHVLDLILMGDAHDTTTGSDIKADLYIMSDIFESSHVAIAAAKMTERVLEEGAIVWCFAQSDRANREVYLKELRKLLLKKDSHCGDLTNLKWRQLHDDDHFFDTIGKEQGSIFDRLILWDINEETVDYA